ncbi:MAG TPA: hypothetical protein GXX20_00075 [Clostridiaceae bacterium]|nr:hypothetical protein [Clostridiaceae bacterium]
MHKSISGIILCFVLSFVLTLPAFAANQVITVDIQAFIYENSSMQVWLDRMPSCRLSLFESKALPETMGAWKN